MAVQSATTTRTHFIPTSSQVRQGFNTAIEKITISWVADSTNGTFVGYVITGGPVIGTLLKVVTNPGATAPTDNYGFTIKDEDGFDVIGGLGVNRDTANTEELVPVMGTYFQRILSNTLTVAISANSVNSANGDIILYIKL